jgi:hypothetical protein
MKNILVSLLCVALCTACSKGKPEHKTSCTTGSGSPITKHVTKACGGAPLVIYKTKHDYSKNISVLLSDDGTQILAFPGVTDVPYQHPIALINGYYAQRMVGNAFTSFTFDEYAASGANYSPQDFFDHLIDCAPFTEYYAGCGGTTDTAYLNDIIRSGQLSTRLEKLN